MVYIHGERIAYNTSVVTCCNPCSHPYKHDGFDKRARGVWDGFIIGLPVSCLPCRAPSSVWRINLLSFFSPHALHTSCLRICYSSPNSVSSHREWQVNLMKWEKGQEKERQTVPRTSPACLFIKMLLTMRGLLSAARRKVYRNSPTPTLMLRGSTTVLPCRLLSDYAVQGLWGQCLAQGCFVVSEEEGNITCLACPVRDKAQTLPLWSVFHVQEVKNKTLCKITHPTRASLCLHISGLFLLLHQP